MSRASSIADAHAANMKAAAAHAATLTQCQTCDGCAHLRALRPMCASEQSPNYRQPRESHHERCHWYAVKGREVARA